MEIQRKKAFIIKTTYYAIIFAAVYIIFRFAIGYLLPFIVSFSLVFILRRPSLFLAERLKIKPKYVSIILVLLSFVAAALLLGLSVFFIIKKIDVNSVIANISGVVSDLSDSLTLLFEKVENFLPKNVALSLQTIMQNIPSNIGGAVTDWLSRGLADVVSQTPKFLLSFVVTVAAGCYFSNEYEPLKNFFFSVVSSNKIALITRIKAVLGKNIFKLIRGYGIITLIIFAVCLGGFLIMGNKNAFLMALIVSLVDLLPVLGTGTVLIPWGVVSALSGNFLGAGVLLLVYICSVIIHHTLEPRFVGKRVGVPPLISLVVMFIALKLFGLIGMFTSVLAMVTIVNIYKTE